MLLNDTQISLLCNSTPGNQNMLTPFKGWQQTQSKDGQKVVSSGLSSVGYDISLRPRIRMYQPHAISGVIDPTNFDDSLLRELDVEGPFFDMPPHGYALGVSVEEFHMPENVAGICMTKSTYARAGLFINTTPLEPGWIGYLTLELANLTPMPIRVYVNQGIAQVLFFQVQRPRVTYADRSGKYQNQPNLPVSPRMK